jgi:choline monooxygenase
VIDPDIARAESLPPDLYTDPEVLARERRTVFAHTWQLVARAEQLAETGAYVATELGGAPVLIVRAADGLRGFHNVCPHRAGPLAQGCGRRQTIQCGYHGWTYRLDGSLLRAPEMDGCDLGTIALAPISVRAWGPLVFAAIAPTVELDQQLGGVTVPTELPFVMRREYALDCNWKVYVDNYLEGYHIPVVHPELHRELDYDAYRTVTDTWWSRQFAPLRADAAVYQPTHEGEEAEYYWVFPNLMLNVYQGQVQTNVVVPLSANRTNVVFEWFGTVSDSIADFSELLQRQDTTICEAVQRNLGSAGARRGRYSPRRENGVHHFHRLYATLLGLTLVLAGAVGCGGKKATPSEDCARACEHMITLGMEEIDRLATTIGGDTATKLKADAAKSHDSDLATCTRQCEAGKLDTGCVLAAKSIDGAMSCTAGAGGGQTPVEPPQQRRDEDWPTAPLREVSGNLAGQAFTMKIPAELQEQDADRSPTSMGWDFPGWPFSQPRFRITVETDAALPATLDQALDERGDRDDKLLDHAISPDEVRLVYQGDTYVVVKRLVRAGTGLVECYGTHSGAMLTAPATIGPWLATICDTLTLR